MVCSICLQAKRKNVFTEGCINLQRSALTRHAATADHKDAISIVQLRKERVVIEEKSQSSRNDGTTLLFLPHNIQGIKIYNNSTDNDRGAGCPK